MPEPTATTQTGSYWDLIIPIVASWVGSKYGNPNGDTPNQYPAVLPPEVKRVADEAWRVYLAGGSPTQQAIRGMAIQSAAQTPGAPPNFQFVSQELKGQPFAGGLKAPTYDLTKIPTMGGVAGAPPLYSQIKPPPGPGFDPGARRERMQLEPPVGGGPAWGTTIYDQLTGGDPMTPADRGRRLIEDDPGAVNRYGPNPPPGVTRAPAGDAWKTVTDAWNNFKTEHPNWAKLGSTAAIAAITAVTGLSGAVIAPIVRRLVLAEAPKPLPPPSKGIGDALRYSPGVVKPSPPPTAP